MIVAVISIWTHMLLCLLKRSYNVQGCLCTFVPVSAAWASVRQDVIYCQTMLSATSEHRLHCLFAGVYVGFGSFLAFTVGANLQEMAISNPGLQKFLYGAIGLPAGLVMVSKSVSIILYQSDRLLLQNNKYLSIAAAMIPAAHSSAKASTACVQKLLVRHVSRFPSCGYSAHGSLTTPGTVAHGDAVSAQRQLSTVAINLLLLQVLVCGAELYTSNTALMPVAYYEKKASLQQVTTPAGYLSVFMHLPLAAGHTTSR